MDIVASRWRTLLIVEVRQRHSPAAALASIDREKIERTMRAAQALVRQHSLERYKLRFDAFGLDANGRLCWERDVVANQQSG